MKKAGLTVWTQESNHQKSVVSNGRAVTWYEQGESVTCLHSKRVGDHSDISSDYFPGYFPKTLASVLSDLGVLPCGHKYHAEGGPADYGKRC